MSRLTFVVSVPKPHWSTVFDPSGQRPVSQSWPEFLRGDLKDLGTFILEQWLRAITERVPIVSLHTRRWEWVIATVVSITEENDLICLRGKAEQFAPARFK